MINLNLIAERRARKIREMTILRVSAMSVVSITVVMVLVNVVAWVVGITTYSELNDVKASLEKQEQPYREWQRIQSEITARKPVVTLLEQVQKSEGAWMTVLGDLSIITPQDVVLDNMTTVSSEKSVRLHLTGRARDERTVGAFMLAISQQTRWAGNPELRNVTAGNKTGSDVNKERPFIRFDLEVPVRGMGGDL